MLDLDIECTASEYKIPLSYFMPYTSTNVGPKPSEMFYLSRQICPLAWEIFGPKRANLYHRLIKFILQKIQGHKIFIL